MPHIGELIRKRRESFGASVAEAAEWAGISQKSLLAAESAEQLGSTLFERICRGLAAAPSELLRGTVGEPTRSVARFRNSGARLLSPSDLRLLAAAAEVGRLIASLLYMLEKKSHFEQYRRVAGVRRDIPPWRDGYELGEAARCSLEVAPGPLRELERFFNDKGIHVARVRFQARDLEAASLWEHGSVPVILINDNAGRAGYSLSRRAKLAHELCHLLHDGGEAEIATRVSLSEESETHEDVIEQRARAFAPAFLAPRPMVREWASHYSSLTPRKLAIELASHWGLSYEGAVWHLKNCQLIAADTAKALLDRPVMELPAERFERETAAVFLRMLDKRLPENASPLMDGWAAYVIHDALETELISIGRARELLQWG